MALLVAMNLSLEDEDSLTERFDKSAEACIDIAVIRYPRISNFTDFNVFEQIPEVSVRYVTSVAELHHPDLIILPGSKNTMSDLKWMRQNGLEAAVKKRAGEIPVFGICGGYQMLGEEITDPEGVEEGGTMRGMELLSVNTEMKGEKVRCQTEGTINTVDGVFSDLSGKSYIGYEIHMGMTVRNNHEKIESVIVTGENKNVYGSYIHGIFDRGDIASSMIETLAAKKGIQIKDGIFEDYQNFKEKEYDKLADTLRQYLNMEEIYGMLREAKITED